LDRKDISRHFVRGTLLSDKEFMIDDSGHQHPFLASWRSKLITYGVFALAQSGKKVYDLCGLPNVFMRTHSTDAAHRFNASIKNVEILMLPDAYNFSRNNNKNKITTTKIALPGSEIRQYDGPVIMQNSDWFYTAEELCKIFSANGGIVITHDFVPGMFNFAGEAHGLVNDVGVVMHVNGGETYRHGYHKWEQSGYLYHDQYPCVYNTIFTDSIHRVIYIQPAPLLVNANSCLQSVQIRLPQSLDSISITSQGIHYIETPKLTHLLNRPLVTKMASRMVTNVDNLLVMCAGAWAQANDDDDTLQPLEIYIKAAQKYYLTTLLPIEMSARLVTNTTWISMVSNYFFNTKMNLYSRYELWKNREYSGVVMCTLPPVEPGHRITMFDVAKPSSSPPKGGGDGGKDFRGPKSPEVPVSTSGPQPPRHADNKGSRSGAKRGGKSETKGPKSEAKNNNATAVTGIQITEILSDGESTTQRATTDPNDDGSGVCPMGEEISTPPTESVGKSTDKTPPKEGSNKDLPKSGGSQQTAKHIDDAGRNIISSGAGGVPGGEESWATVVSRKGSRTKSKGSTSEGGDQIVDASPRN
jgi:hypothetical protein